MTGYIKIGAEGHCPSEKIIPSFGSIDGCTNGYKKGSKCSYSCNIGEGSPQFGQSGSWIRVGLCRSVIKDMISNVILSDLVLNVNVDPIPENIKSVGGKEKLIAVNVSTLLTI